MECGFRSNYLQAVDEALGFLSLSFVDLRVLWSLAGFANRLNLQGVDTVARIQHSFGLIGVSLY